MIGSAHRVLVTTVLLGIGAALFVPGERGYGQGGTPGLLARPEPRAPQLKVLERLRGTWDVTVTTRAPQAGTMTYVEAYEWVLDQRFLRGETSQKSDGTHDIFMATYDPVAKGYRFWMFSSAGSSVELPKGTWDEKTQSMEWKSPPQMDVSFRGQWIFPDKDSRRWTAVLKDWKGNIILDAVGTATRRR